LLHCHGDLALWRDIATRANLAGTHAGQKKLLTKRFSHARTDFEAAGEKTPSTACFIACNNTLQLVEEPLWMLGAHVGGLCMMKRPRGPTQAGDNTTEGLSTGLACTCVEV